MTGPEVPESIDPRDAERARVAAEYGWAWGLDVQWPFDARGRLREIAQRAWQEGRTPIETVRSLAGVLGGRRRQESDRERTSAIVGVFLYNVERGVIRHRALLGLRGSAVNGQLPPRPQPAPWTAEQQLEMCAQWLRYFGEHSARVVEGRRIEADRAVVVVDLGDRPWRAHDIARAHTEARAATDGRTLVLFATAGFDPDAADVIRDLEVIALQPDFADGALAPAGAYGTAFTRAGRYEVTSAGDIRGVESTHGATL